MGLFIDCPFLFEVQLLCLSLHIEFCHLKIVSGSVDTRKWSSKWRNLNISDIFFSLSSIGGESSGGDQRHLHHVWGQCHRRESTERKWFSRFQEDRFDISDTPRWGRSSGFDEDRLNTLIHNDPRQCPRELGTVMNCDHSVILWHLNSMGCMGTACSKPGVFNPRPSGEFCAAREGYFTK